MKFSESLQKNQDFRRVYSRGKSRANQVLVLYVLRNEGQTNRIGISVSKKIGNSVIRHQIKRRLKESYRLNENRFDRGLDIVVIARSGAKERDFFGLERALMYLSGKLGILLPQEEDML